jgi:undecaprenyl-diphosphatase
MRPRSAAVLCAFVTAGQGAIGAHGPLGIDHPMSKEDTGVWARPYQNALMYGSALVAAGGALWLGNDDPLGHVYWQSVDSMIIADVSAAVLKPIFGRSRPSQTDDPNQWFQGHGHNSFPSGEVAHIAGVVTPFILEYGPRYPAVYALELLPIYDGLARIKSKAHWTSDVLAGFALGTAAGYYSHSREVPITVKILPKGIAVGIQKSF